MSPRLAVLGIVLAAVAGLAGLVAWAPDYLGAQGFPLDDAWIHAVYGRALARSGMLAYNPGLPATGSTAPLWSALVALPHLLAAGAGVVLWIKLAGFACHMLTALVLFAALRDGTPADVWSAAGGALVAAHPDLVSASVSGMEVPLATLAAASTLYVAARAGALASAAVAACAFLVRPELAVVSLSVPVLLYDGRRGSGDGRVRCAVAGRRIAGAAAGIAVAGALLAARNWAVSGWPLPATFYAKVGHGPPLLDAVRFGFAGLLGQLPLTDSLLLLGASLGIAALMLRTSAAAGAAVAAAAFISGLLFCATSFALIAPIDAQAFYHQRYVLPALPLLIAALPVLLHAALRRSLPARSAAAAATAIVLLFAGLLVRSAPQRFAHLANDARNIDDVQVALGRHLAGADPHDVVWVVDAGAVRYFGNAFVVDMLGLNTPELLGADAQAFLDAHPPRWVELVATWSALRVAPEATAAGVIFEPSTPYTVTGFPDMARHRLVGCAASDAPARFGVRGRVFAVACEPLPGTFRSPGLRAGARCAARATDAVSVDVDARPSAPLSVHPVRSATSRAAPLPPRQADHRETGDVDPVERR